MPCILAWIGNDTKETDANLIQYYEPPLPKEKLDATRLDAIYRIVQSRPPLWHCNTGYYLLSNRGVSQHHVPIGLEVSRYCTYIV